MTDATLVFIHIPKSAGTTLNRILDRRYRRAETIKFATLDRPLSDFSQIPDDQRSRARLVRGHIHFGIHEWLPQPVSYVTVLRDPVKRVLSLYGYILREPRHPLHERLTGSGMRLEEFIETSIDKNQTENGQTRQIAGVQEGDPQPYDLERAIENLRNFSVVGLTERFDESIMIMKKVLGWRMPFYSSRNVTKPLGSPRPEVSERARELIRQRNELDIELYEEAVRVFDRLVAIQGARFERQVAVFEKLNVLPDAVGSRASTFVDRVKSSRPVRSFRGT